MYKLLVEIGVSERINAMPKKQSNNIKGRLKSLGNDPFPDGRDKKEIEGTRKSIYRLRVGDHRFFYIIDIKNRIVKVTEFMTAGQAHRIYGRM